MRILVMSIGTTGDALPFIGIARTLADRGHDVTVLGNGEFRSLADRASLPFVELLSGAEYQKRLKERAEALDLESLKVNARYVIEDIPAVHQAILEHNDPGNTVVVAQGLLVGARIACEEIGVPLATVHLQPMCFRSELDRDVWPWWLPRFAIRLMFQLVDALSDAALAKPINQFRASRSLAPVRSILGTWWNSPDLVIGMFPDWLVRPQADWPPQSMLAGFPFPQVANKELDTRLEEFLRAGEPPIVFSHSSAVRYLPRYFEESIAAARALGYRSLLLAPDSSLDPGDDGKDVLFARYAPHDVLLPRTKLLVHHGGLGTAAAALRAGIPQLIVPQMLDQPNNAAHLKRLGVAESIGWKKYRAKNIRKKLESLLSRPDLTDRCRDASLNCHQQKDAFTVSADAIERMAHARLASVATQESST